MITPEYKLIIHRIDIAFRVNHEDIEQILKQFNINETKEKSGEKYNVKVFKETKGESLAIYEYRDKTIARVNTHKLSRRQYIIDYINHFGLQIVRDYLELYARIHDKNEFSLYNALLAYAESNGLGYTTKIITREWKRLVYLTRTDKHKVADVYHVIKLYRDKELKEQPKLEIAIFNNRLLKKEDVELAGKRLVAILKLTKAKQVFNDYDIAQDYILINTYDRVLYRQLYATHKRLSISTLLNRDIKDKKLAIAMLLDRGLSIQDISKLIGYSDRMIRYIIAELLDQQIIERVAKGKYKLKLTKKQIQVNRQEEHPPAHVIHNLEIDNVIIEELPKWAKDRERALLYIKQKYNNVEEHPESTRYKFYPPIYYIKNSDGGYIYILCQYRYYRPV